MDRLLITVLIIGGLALLWLGWNFYKSRLVNLIDAAEATGTPTLLYFTADYCTTCKFQQSPIVQRLAKKLGAAVAVKKIDVSTQPELANRYKVLTLPTTVVLTPQGRVAHINYGVAPESQLESQLSMA